ncbi:hypothetical protein [Echinicola vietnamensis]|uniref:hypothetical protein n=1 Tax=Echinicola vietnamensis TaxID=390884 RepID=UPI0012F8CF44|nr:hypothetical protein [Echinicola vietnamensis]
MKLFINKKHKARFWISWLVMALIFMWLMPYGSFNPTIIGFWMSVLTAGIIAILTSVCIASFKK